MRREEPLAQMSDMWRERCHKAERERDLSRRDYECMNKFREAAEAERDQLREALATSMRYFDQVIAETGYQSEGERIAHEKARSALAATEEPAQ